MPSSGTNRSREAHWKEPAMSWIPLDAILVVVLATLYAGFYALLTGRGYRRLLVAWLASLAGAIVGYFLGQALQLHVLWFGTLPFLEVTLGSVLLLVLALRFRIG
jgi:uncharacterized membrane protein YeaQ/YmgE (transglycosylase-associated protein family)